MSLATAVKGIIFDLDNTLLRSAIDFSAMKRDTARLLQAEGLLPAAIDLSAYTASMLIERAKGSPEWTDQLDRQLWAMISEHERIGMLDAKLEHGAVQVLKLLQGKLTVALLTNNSYSAASAALAQHDIDGYFQIVIAREQAIRLKPSPDGIHRILEKFPKIPATNWISVGDSWIDGKASLAAGVSFVAYHANEDELLKHNITPVSRLDRLDKLIPLCKIER